MKRVEWLLLALIVAAGIFFRLYRLDAIPPGMTHDEADVGYHAAAVYATGERHIVDAPYGFIHQPFVQYSGALFMRLFGPTDLTQRLHSAFFGTLLIVVTTVWARHAFDAWIALTAAAFMAVGFWPVMTSRFALNNQPVPTLFAIGIGLLWTRLLTPTPTHSQPFRRTLIAITSGLFLGLSVYPYEAGRAALASIPVLGAYLFLLSRLSHTPIRPHSLRPIVIALIVAALVAAPHLLDPRSWGRTGTLVSETVGSGGLNSLVSTIAAGLGMIFVKGDPFVTYNIPDRPIFDPILAIPFVVGLAIAIRKWRMPAYGYTLIWLAFGLLPTLVVGAFTSTIHSIAAQPPIFVLLAIGAVAIARLVTRHRPIAGTHFSAGAIGIGALVIFSAIITASDYFDRWANAPAVRAAYYNYLASLLDHVNSRSDVRDVAISSAFPDKPLDPFIAARRLRRAGVMLRHFDARRAIVFPDTDSALLLIPALTPIDSALAERLDLPAPETIQMRPDDLIQSFDAYNWNPRATSDRLISAMTPYSANFGAALELTGAQVVTPNASPGGEVVVLTLWRVIDPTALGPIDETLYDRAVVLFTHMLDPNGALVAQEDRLDAPVSSWQAGDTFAQVHRLVIKPDAAPGAYRLLVGAYVLPTRTRLQVSSGEDIISVGEVEVGQ